MVERAKGVSQNCDRLLATVVSECDEASRERAIETLMLDHARGIVSRVLLANRQNIRQEHFDDIASTVNLRIVRRLRQLDQEPIARFDDYVATITYNVIYDFLRSRYPQRTRLKNRVRHALTNDSRFAIWDTKGGTTAGLAAWNGRGPVPPATSVEDSEVGSPTDPRRTANTIAAIFNHNHAPMLLDDLVNLLADLWDVTDLHAVDAADLAASEASGPAVQFESRQYLSALWAEVQALRQPQRAALLLNLRDGEGRNAVALLLLARIATTQQVAEAIGITPGRLAEFWNDLPLDDLRIGEMLGVTRQQVINLRKAARERLARRMNFDRRKP